jgi:hypothetical protein
MRSILSKDITAILSDPSIDGVWLLCYLENTSPFLEGIRPIATKATLAPICQLDTLVSTPKVIIMIVATGDPFNCLLFNKGSKETCVHCAT